MAGYEDEIHLPFLTKMRKKRKTYVYESNNFHRNKRTKAIISSAAERKLLIPADIQYYYFQDEVWISDDEDGRDVLHIRWALPPLFHNELLIHLCTDVLKIVESYYQEEWFIKDENNLVKEYTRVCPYEYDSNESYCTEFILRELNYYYMVENPIDCRFFLIEKNKKEFASEIIKDSVYQVVQELI